ncbi:EGF-like domain protein [Ostertagia ostertagi]
MFCVTFPLILWSVALGDRGLLRCPKDFLCHNNGTCDENGDCICKTGWSGDMCEIEAISCPDQPCKHGFCLTDEEGRHACRCDYRFEGQYCELDKDECALKVCPAYATCVNLIPKDSKDKGYSCICPEGYTGDLCDREVDLCKVHNESGSNYCYNGGVCEARYVCMCQNGFGGPRCAHRVPRLEEYEEFGCPVRPEVCAKVFDDGHCDEICNRESCLFDGFDCAKTEGAICRHPSECAYKYGDSNCDEECAGPECGYDGGDCEGKNGTSYSTDANMIGVAVGVPPDTAIKNLRQLQAELAQRLYTHVSLAEDMDGIMVFEWGTETGQGNRITVIDEEVVASNVDMNMNGTMVFFDVDTSACRIQRRKGHKQPRCFTDLRAAATYLTLELARKGPSGGETLPIRDVSWRKKQMEELPMLTPPVVFIIVCIVVLIIILTLCSGIVVAIVRARRRRQTAIFAPCWKIPTKSPLLMAVRRGDHKKVKEMISSNETFVDANGLGPLHHAVANNDAKMLQLLINCGQLDLFEKSVAGQSPLLFAARIAHPGLECVSLLVSAIDIIRKRRHDDVLSKHFEDLQKDRKDLLKMLPLHDEADAKYALTDAMGRNVIHYAALCNAAHLVNYFAACGANVNLIDDNGDAPIHLAAKDANVEALVALLRNNCDVDVRDAFDRTAYAIADSKGHSVICGVLLISKNAPSTRLLEQIKGVSIV